MNKSEAVQAMKEGKKLTHRWFSNEEWITDKDGAFEFEDGCRCGYEEFFEDRDSGSWQTGWSLYK